MNNEEIEIKAFFFSISMLETLKNIKKTLNTINLATEIFSKQSESVNIIEALNFIFIK